MRPDGDESAAPVIDRDTIASVAVAATFTAEPLTERLASWLHELSPAATVALTPFNQVFQELLRPAGALNQAALRVVLFRLEDWHGRGPPRDKTDATAWAEVLDELVSAVRVAADYNPGPLLVVHCPPSPQYAADGAACDASIHVEQRLAAVRLERANVWPIVRSELGVSSPSDYYDADADRLAVVPYSSSFLATLATLLARRIHAIVERPRSSSSTAT